MSTKGGAAARGKTAKGKRGPAGSADEALMSKMGETIQVELAPHRLVGRHSVRVFVTSSRSPHIALHRLSLRAGSHVWTARVDLHMGQHVLSN